MYGYIFISLETAKPRRAGMRLNIKTQEEDLKPSEVFFETSGADFVPFHSYIL